MAAVRGAEGGPDRGDLVLGLERANPEVLVLRELVEDVGRGRDRVGAEEQRQAEEKARKAEEEKSKSKKELATLIAKAVNKGVKRQLASLDKKRKSDLDEEDGDCCLLDTLTSDPDGFNCEDMEKLSVDDGDEISV